MAASRPERAVEHRRARTVADRTAARSAEGRRRLHQDPARPGQLVEQGLPGDEPPEGGHHQHDHGPDRVPGPAGAGDGGSTGDRPAARGGGGRRAGRRGRTRSRPPTWPPRRSGRWPRPRPPPAARPTPRRSPTARTRPRPGPAARWRRHRWPGSRWRGCPWHWPRWRSPPPAAPPRPALARPERTTGEHDDSDARNDRCIRIVMDPPFAASITTFRRMNRFVPRNCRWGTPVSARVHPAWRPCQDR